MEGINDSRFVERDASGDAKSVVPETGDDIMVDGTTVILEETLSVEHCFEMVRNKCFLDDVSRLLIMEVVVSTTMA